MKKFILLATVGLAGCIGMMENVGRFMDDVRVTAKIAVMSHLEIAWPVSAQPFEKALRFCRDEGVDAVVVIGDPTARRLRNQYDVFQATFRKIFPRAHVLGTPQLIVVTNRVELEVKGFRFAVQESRPLGRQELPTFYGGPKLALTDALSSYPIGGNAFSAGSMRGVDVPQIYEPLMPTAQARVKNSAQGLLVKAFGTTAQIRRMDFANLEDVGEAWTAEPRTETAPKLAKEKSEAPEFWPDTRLTITRGYDAKGNAIYTVRWPNLLARHVGVRAFSYDVAVQTEGNPDLVRHVLPDGFFQSESRDTAAVRLTLSKADLPAGRPFRISVTPLSSLGTRGKPLVSDLIRLNTEH